MEVVLRLWREAILWGEINSLIKVFDTLEIDCVGLSLMRGYLPFLEIGVPAIWCLLKTFCGLAQ